MAELRARFRGRIVLERARLLDLVQAGDLHGDAIRALAHNLAGAGGSFGYPEISRAAMRIDDALVQGQGAGPDDVQALIDAIDRACSDPS